MSTAQARDPSAPTPTPVSARVPALDALRGFALLGIALVNLPWIASSRSLMTLLGREELRAALHPLDLVAASFVELGCEGRFYPIFAALFGVGVGVIGGRGLRPHTQRALALVAMGALHASFGWWGDILLDYGVVALLLTPLLPGPAKWSWLLVAISLAAALVASHFYDGWYSPDTAAERAAADAMAAAEAQVYGGGGFVEVTALRIEALSMYFDPWNWSYRLNTVACAAAGLALQRAGLARRPEDFVHHLPKLALGFGALGVALSLGIAWWTPLYVVAGDALAMAYASLFLWLALRGKLGAALGAMAVVGRLSLSHYLFQTLVFTSLAYGYGAALYDRLGPALSVAISLSVWALGAALALGWQRRWGRGPMERLLRALTYAGARPGAG